MKKFLTLIVLLAFAFCSMLAHADDRDLTHKRIGELETYSGATASGDLTIVYDASDGNVKTIDARTGPTQSGDVTFQSTLLAAGRKNGVSTLSSSSTQLLPSTLPYVIMVKNIGGTGADDTDGGTRLQNGTPGQVLVLFVEGVEHSGTWIVTPATSYQFITLTFNAALDSATLLYVNDTIGWIILDAVSVTVAPNSAAFGFRD